MNNVGVADKVVRAVVAIVAVVLAVVIGGGRSILLWVIAAIMASTAVTGMCPIYKVIGVSTKPKASA